MRFKATEAQIIEVTKRAIAASAPVGLGFLHFRRDCVIIYVIKHKKTHRYMPQLNGRGYSHWNPNSDDPKNDMRYSNDRQVPRIFNSYRKANAAIAAWAAFPNARSGYDYMCEPTGLKVEPDGRKKRRTCNRILRTSYRTGIRWIER